MELPHPLLSAHQLSRLQGMPAYWAWVQAAMQLASPVEKSRKVLVARMMSACRPGLCVRRAQSWLHGSKQPAGLLMWAPGCLLAAAHARSSIPAVPSDNIASRSNAINNGLTELKDASSADWHWQ